MALTKPTFDVNNIQGLGTIVEEQETALKVLFDKTGADAKTYLIALCDQIDLNIATKAELAGIILGQITDGSLTDVKLSNAAGQIKERVATHVALSSSGSVLGHVELATAEETTTGTDATRAVTPLGLKSATDLLIPLSQATWVKIAEQTLSSAVSQVDFASIPSGYKNLRLFIDARCDSTTSPGELRMLLNNDTGSNYQGVSSTTAYASLGLLLSRSTLGFGFARVDISNFSPTQFKRAIIDSVQVDTGISNSQSAFSWRNSTTEINNISLYGASVLLNVGSRFVLWGCK